MKCPKCQFENQQDAKFCNQCASKIEIVCPGCGTGNLPGSRYCKECARDLSKPMETPSIDYSQPQSYTPKFLADRILQSRSALEGERKQVTVLFVDLKGPMALAEQVDTEEWHRILDRFFHITPLSGVDLLICLGLGLAMLVLIDDQCKVIREALRVLKINGFAGWIELTWQKEPSDGSSVMASILPSPQSTVPVWVSTRQIPNVQAPKSPPANGPRSIGEH